MKKTIKTLVLGLTIGTVTANAQGVLNFKNEQSNLVQNQEIVFSNKITKKIAKADLDTYKSVMELYNNQNVAFYNLSKVEQERFEVASNKMLTSLSKSRKAAKKEFAKQIQNKMAIYSFIWNTKNTASDNIELVEIPAEIENYTSL